ncbi:MULTISPECIES: helix-turn-helix transcriptional regulator [Salinicoccus]|uniref:helix-turn-helix transcriptional regulator n=1 Tax=Salinicoccus TaxID=45669 RepID=UPI0004E1F258|nr:MULTISPECIES: helix-turn-helix transcriptional regulator [Salinicoccus]RPE54515.1 putative transcriptional regulator [Salinicoccus roseus]GGA64921.1 transcriptional regulator [Salinicoccus roseus]
MKNNTDNRIREYRKKSGYTQQQLAKKVGVTRLTIISLEKKRYEASVGLAIKISRVFACPVEELFIVEE